MLERLLFTIRLIDGITKKGPHGVLVAYPNRGRQDSSQGTTAKSDGKSENPLRELKEHEGNYKLKPGNRTLFMQKEKKQCLYIHSIYLRSLKPRMLLWHENI